MDDLDGGRDTHDGYKALVHGEPLEVRVQKNITAEVDASPRGSAAPG